MDQPPDIPQRPMGRIPVVARLVRGKGTLRTYGEQLRKALTCDPATMMQITSAAQRARVSADRRRVHGCAGQAAVADPAVDQEPRGPTVGVDDQGDRRLGEHDLQGRDRRRDRRQEPVRRGLGSSATGAGDQGRALGLAQVVAMAAQMPASCQAMVFLGAGCGQRQGELFGVGVDDVDFLGRVVHVRRQVRLIDGVQVFSLPKGGKQRSVPLPHSVGLRLSAHIGEHSSTEVTLPWGRPGWRTAHGSLAVLRPWGVQSQRRQPDLADRPSRGRYCGIPN